LNLEAFNSTSYPGSGTTWFDLSGNNYNASLINGPTFSTDGTGCIVLDGVNDYISLATTGFAPASYSVELWIKKTAGDVDGYILARDNSDNPEDRLSWDVANNRLLVQVYDDGSYRWNQYIGSVNTNTWYHFVLTVTNGSQIFYVNGTQIGSASGLYNGSASSNLGEHTIGTYNRPGTGYGGYFAGRFAAYRFYTKVLTQSEVTQNFNARKWRFGL
jgi:hypothetical protein